MALRSNRPTLVGVVLCAGVAMLQYGVAVGAHEIGTTRVSVVFHEDRAYEIEIATDATALAEKLEAAAGRFAPVDTSVDRLQSLFVRSEAAFRTRVKVAFDGVDDRPAISYLVSPADNAASAMAATIRLTGHVPNDARQFTWSFGWTFATYAITTRRPGSEKATTAWLEGGQRSAPVSLTLPPSPVDRLVTAWNYLTLGFTHILPNGLDHMLFVLGIYLLSRSARAVLLQVSAFTIAHSITLALSMYGLLSLPPRIVEPMIALSIAYVAVENLFFSELKARRVALVFAFGLLHGLGFAGALAELGLPRSEFVTALVAFNVGVEAGQLAVIAGAVALVGWHYSRRPWYRRRIVVPASIAIACTAVYWTIERLSP